MSEGFDTLPDHVEIVEIAGVAVPAVCRDRLDEAALTAVADVLDDYNVTQYRVSPVGNLQVGVGSRRPTETVEQLKSELTAASHGVTVHGVERGFLRLRVALVED